MSSAERLAPFLALALACGASPAQPPEHPAGTRPSSPTGVGSTPSTEGHPHAASPSVTLPANREEPGDVALSIQRQARSPQEASLILRAEAICPARSEVVAARRFPAREEDPPESECLWWYYRFDGIRIAYAITGEAVDYYAARIAEFRAGDFTSTAGIHMNLAGLEYRASVSHQARFEHAGRVFVDVDVVELSLGWSQFCGAECAMGFGATRWVVFPAQGEPVVLGNEATPYIVS